jgi:hypothetical protein
MKHPKTPTTPYIGTGALPGRYRCEAWPFWLRGRVTAERRMLGLGYSRSASISI